MRGAPGTGKTYLAKEIVTDIISNGNLDDFSMLTDEQKQQVEFVQFHPSYDYSDLPVSIESPNAIEAIRKSQNIVFGYPIYYSNIPKIVRDYIY